MNTKNLVLRKNGKGQNFYNYKATVFKKISRDEDGLLQEKRSNIFNLELRMNPLLISEISNLVKKKNMLIEVTKNLIFLRSACYDYTVEAMDSIGADFEDPENLQAYNNEDFYKFQKSRIDDYIEENFYIPFDNTDLFTHNLDETHELTIKYVVKDDKAKNGRLLFQIIKTQLNSKKLLYVNRATKPVLRQFNKLIK